MDPDISRKSTIDAFTDDVSIDIAIALAIVPREANYSERGKLSVAGATSKPQ